MDVAPEDREQLRPSYIASVGGFLRPGRDTPREGAAGLTLIAGLAALAGVGLTVWRGRSSRQS